jgi:hypothetical protein
LIHAEYDRRTKLEYPALHARSFPNIGKRTREAQKRIGIIPDEVYRGVLDVGDMLSINNTTDVIRCTEAAEKAPVDGADPSILIQARNVNIGEDDIVRCIRDARDNVKESARLQRAADMVGRAATAYQQEHAAEINANIESDFARQREMAHSSRMNRRRRLLKST